ncbi:MAG: aminotransferase class V-fold PLP-dependent enzyme [Clostridia bacterium]|nr:aminotransferase class V-fold PLP-dependent enzyme [Clostridia bacterium]
MVYFDNAATTSPKPEVVREAVAYALKNLSANPGRSGHDLSLAASQMVYECRVALSKMFGFSSPERVVFTLNCTHAINMVIKGLSLNNCKIVTSSLEHNAVMRPLEKLKKQGCTIAVAEVFMDDPEATVRSFAGLIDDHTKLVICTHVSNVCGAILPIEQIGRLCRERGVLFAVDGAQSAGVLPIDMEKMNIDFLCIPGHKGLYGPMGTGVLFCGKDIPNTLTEGGTGNRSVSLIQPDEYPERMESGTVNLPGIAGLKAGIGFVNQKTIPHIHGYEMGLIQAAYRGLKNIRGVTLYTPYPQADLYAPVLCFNIGTYHSAEAAELLNQAGFALRAGLHCAPAAHRRLGTISYGAVRMSPSIFNRNFEVQALLNRISRLAQKLY